MKFLNDLFSGMSMTFRSVVIVAAISVVVGAWYWLFGGNVASLVTLCIGLLIVAGLLWFYFKILRGIRQRRAALLGRSLRDDADNSRANDLKVRFSEGVEKFRRAGKDLYSLPWYLVVGESSSGKTEAIRHSQLRFPSGLQDRCQGVGGTTDMHWWFTSDGILLDTAGRIFEEADPLAKVVIVQNGNLQKLSLDRRRDIRGKSSRFR